MFAADIGGAPPPAAAAAAAVSLGLAPRLDGTDPCRASAWFEGRGCCAPSGNAGGGEERRVGTSGVVHPGATPERGSGSALVELSCTVPVPGPVCAASLGRPEYTGPGLPYWKNADASLIGRCGADVRARLWRAQMTRPRRTKTIPKKPPTTPPTMAPTCDLALLSCTGVGVGVGVDVDVGAVEEAVAVVVTVVAGVVEAGRVDGPWLAAAPIPVRIRVGVG